MKRLLTILLASATAITMTACTATETPATDTPAEETTSTEEAAPAEEATPATVTVSVENATGEMVDVDFPTDADRIVVLNWQTMDFLDAVGMGDKVVGLIKGGSYPSHLEEYVLDENIQNVGGMKDIDMEAVMSLEPDIIFSSDRTAEQYDEFSIIAPTMSAAIVYEDGFMNSYKELAEKHGQIFGIEGEVNDIIADYETRIAAIADFAGDQTAVLGIFAGGLNTLGDNGRANIITTDMGFNNLAAGEDVNHGNISSYDAWLALNPDWMFVLDKDNAVGEEATAAKEQMENDIIAQTSAYQNDQIVYLEPGAAWYLCDGGITALDQMITCIEEGIGLK